MIQFTKKQLKQFINNRIAEDATGMTREEFTQINGNYNIVGKCFGNYGATGALIPAVANNALFVIFNNGSNLMAY